MALTAGVRSRLTMPISRHGLFTGRSRPGCWASRVPTSKHWWTSFRSESTSFQAPICDGHWQGLIPHCGTWVGVPRERACASYWEVHLESYVFTAQACGVISSQKLRPNGFVDYDKNTDIRRLSSEWVLNVGGTSMNGLVGLKRSCRRLGKDWATMSHYWLMPTVVFPLPGRLKWGRCSSSTASSILKNPAHTGSWSRRGRSRRRLAWMSQAVNRTAKYRPGGE